MVWQDTRDGKKGRFLMNLCHMSKQWPKGSVRLSRLAYFVINLQHGDSMLTMDTEKGYQHLRLHRSMRQ